MSNATPSLPLLICERAKSLTNVWVGHFSNERGFSSGIQFTRHFIEIIVVETKEFVSSNVNVILTQQTCSQRSSMSTGSKR